MRVSSRVDVSGEGDGFVLPLGKSRVYFIVGVLETWNEGVFPF